MKDFKKIFLVGFFLLSTSSVAYAVQTGGAGSTNDNSIFSKLGIGTTNPDTNLHVVGDAKITGLVSCDSIDTDADGNLSCGTDSGATPFKTMWDDDLDTGIQIEESADDDTIRFDTAGAERMFIDANGDIGINTTGPLTAHLQIGQGGHMNAALSINGTPGDTGIVAFRDEDGEDIFTALGSLANNDFKFFMGDIGNAYGNSYGGTTGIIIDQADESYQFGRAAVKFMANSGEKHVGLIAPAIVDTSVIWTLPNGDGGNGQVIATNGNGSLSWKNANILPQKATVTCDNTIEGGLFYDSSSHHFYGCDGTSWLQLDN